jgi:hypothetical protein
MDENIKVLLILVVVAIVVAVGVSLFQSKGIRRYGLLGAFRRKFSGGGRHSHYEG